MSHPAESNSEITAPHVPIDDDDLDGRVRERAAVRAAGEKPTRRVGVDLLVDAWDDADPAAEAAKVVVAGAPDWWLSDAGVVRVSAVVSVTVGKQQGWPGFAVWADLSTGKRVRLPVGPFKHAEFANRVVTALVVSAA
ncbi:hypothetical protein Q0Z83_042960 [Actinoplanes sichuanensis]|uniref:PemK-like, MazF-like toxin of type II toxin-antitoxin system n=1 Tax=Actinoplanes sichuanensis TaxID=512349 RepID=A0ABW4AKW0_9ACTN|nr:hypothetical protein [Actinoplanes sichuanensis]BEL06105.1 hypothetical protein Q0Z83_042960 [Actinoplanes sichuanensis]